MKCYSAAYIRSDRRVLSPTPTLPVHTGIIIFSHCYKAKGRETSILPLWRWPSLPRLALPTLPWWLSITSSFASQPTSSSSFSLHLLTASTNERCGLWSGIHSSHSLSHSQSTRYSFDRLTDYPSIRYCSTSEVRWLTKFSSSSSSFVHPLLLYVPSNTQSVRQGCCCRVIWTDDDDDTHPLSSRAPKPQLRMNVASI